MEKTFLLHLNKNEHVNMSNSEICKAHFIFILPKIIMIRFLFNILIFTYFMNLPP